MSEKRINVQPTARGTYTGVASDQLPDCVGDRMLAWKTPVTVPLLIGHDGARPAIGEATLTTKGNILSAELDLAPVGTSEDADEARRIIEAGIARLSIGFEPLKPGVPNDHGGLDYPLVGIRELSLVGAGCVASARVGGKCACTAPAVAAEPLLYVEASPRYRVDPGDITKAVAAATKDVIRQKVAEAAGALDWDGYLATQGRRKALRGPALPGTIVRLLGRPEEAKAAPEPAPGSSFEPFTTRQAAPARLPPTLEVPEKYLRAGA